MNQIGPDDQPEPRLLAKWLYDRLKRHPIMRRHVDKVRDSPIGSDLKTFEWFLNLIVKSKDLFDLFDLF